MSAQPDALATSIELARRVANELSEALGDQASAFTCAEADLIVEFMRMFGQPQFADEFLALHVEGDLATDPHRSA